MAYYSKHKSDRLRNRVFIGFLTICFLSVTTSSILSFIILNRNAKIHSKTDMQNKSEALMSYLDYALSHTQVETRDIPKILKNEIYEFADINKHDIILYDLKGNYLISNKDPNLVSQKKMPDYILKKIRKTGKQYDDKTYNAKLNVTVISSYMILKNNMLEDIAYVYFPNYYNESTYIDVFKPYFAYLVGVNILIVLFGIWFSWIISNNLTDSLTKFSQMISRVNLFDRDLKPIKYYKNDELNALVRAYNKMVAEIADQRTKLTYIEKQTAWQEMAKQVAHEVKNPLTPMKLTMQNFERKFDPNDPDISIKVKKLSRIIMEQIDVISRVAGAFSEFAKLPEKKDEEISLNDEIEKVVTIFSEENIFVHSNQQNIRMKIDRDYFTRIITNLVVNAGQAKAEGRKSVINVYLERIEKRIKITVEDNGIGIPRDKIERVFEPNFTSKSYGMGIGLTMVKRMIEEYNGNITVKSEEGKGAIFTISMLSGL